MKILFRPENLIVGITADEEGYQGVEKEVADLKKIFILIRYVPEPRSGSLVRCGKP